MIVDSSVLIPLATVGRLDLLKKFGGVATTDEVRRECVIEGGGKPGSAMMVGAFDDWVSVANVSEKLAAALAHAEGIQLADATVLLLAERRSDVLVANDWPLRRVAKARRVVYWWPSRLVLEAARRGHLPAREAKAVYLALVREAKMRVKANICAAVVAQLDAMDP